MFRKVRKQLTWFNSIIIGLFLLIFAAVVFVSLVWAVYVEEKRNVLVYAAEEAVENLDIIKNKEFLKSGFSKNELEQGKRWGRGEGIFFYYVFDNHGKLIHYSEPRPEVRRRVMASITSGDAKFNLPVLTAFRHKNKSFMAMMVSLPLQEQGTVYGKIYVGKDVSEFYRLLKKILYTMLGLVIIFLTSVTFIGYIMAGKAMEPIRHSYERQREFLADASHELRTPLSVLLASVDAIQRDEENQITPFTVQVLSDMKDEIKKMSHIVGDLLTLARSDAAVLKLMKEQFDLKLLAEQVVRTVHPLALEKNIGLKLEFLGNNLIYADKERMAQLLLILVDNAIKYTPENGDVRVFIRPLGTNRPGIEIVVEDNGIGIAAEEQKLIFERFYRVDKARSRQMGGTGLGLSIAKWIAETHGGSIQVMSQPGQGSKFIVVLPQ